MAGSNLWDHVYDYAAAELEHDRGVMTAHEKLEATIQQIRDSHGPHNGIYEDLAGIARDVERYSVETMRAAFMAGMRFSSSTLLVGLGNWRLEVEDR